MINLNIKIGKKETIFLSSILMAFVITGLVIAYGGNTPNVMGHSGGEIDIQKNGITIPLQQAITSGIISYPGEPPKTFFIGGGDLTFNKLFDCRSEDLQKWCGDEDGCQIDFLMQNEGSPTDEVVIRTQKIYMEQSPATGNSPTGVSGNTQKTNGDVKWIAGTSIKNFISTVNTNWVEVFNYPTTDCTVDGNVDAFTNPYQFLFRSDKSISAKVIVYD